MTAAEYLYDLRKRLSKLPPQEIQQAMSYYEEYFAEAGPEGEAELINRLGTPAQVASTIISEYAIKDMSGEGETKSKGSGFKTMWIVIIAVLASPVAIPIAIALLAVVFSLLVALFSIFFSFFVAALAMVVAGVVAAVVGVVGLFTFPIEAIAIMGVSLIIVSLGLALGIGTIKLFQLTIKGITWIFATILGRKGGQK
jgi:uncharacterized membrane protein